MKKELNFAELEAQVALELPERELFFTQIGLLNIFAAVNAAANVCLAQANVVIGGVGVEQGNVCYAEANQDIDLGNGNGNGNSY